MVTLIIILSVLAVAVLGPLALIYIPSPKFEPFAYEPNTPAYWPTGGFKTAAPEEPEEQGLDSQKLRGYS